MILNDMAQILQNNGLGVVSSDLFYARMPDQPDDAVCLYEYAGRAPTYVHSGLSYTSPGLQVVVRSKSYATAKAKIENIFTVLQGLTNITVGDKTYLRVDPQQSPFPMGPDENERHRLAVNFNVGVR